MVYTFGPQSTYLWNDDVDLSPELVPDGLLHDGRLGEASNQEDVANAAVVGRGHCRIFQHSVDVL